MKLTIFIAIFLITISTSACSNSKITDTPIITVTNAPTAKVINTPIVTVTNIPAASVTSTPTATVSNAPTATATNTPTATVTNIPTEPITIDSKWVYFDEDGLGKYYIDYIGKKVINAINEKTDDRVFVIDNFIYFCSFTKIYKISSDGNGLVNLYSRPDSGVDMYITKVEDGWIYFEVISEDGISKDRIKLNGDGYEHIGQEYIDE